MWGLGLGGSGLLGWGGLVGLLRLLPKCRGVVSLVGLVFFRVWVLVCFFWLCFNLKTI